jgi:hypothetical protein
MRSLSVSNNDENVDQVKELFLQNRRTTIPQVANILHMPFGSVEQIWKENLKMHHIAAKSVPKPVRCMCLCVNFWLKTKLPSFHTFCTHQTHSHVIYFFS